MEPVAPGTEDEVVDFNSLNKQETENDRLLKQKAVLRNGQFSNVFELSFVNGNEHWFCKVCECPVMGRVYQHEIGRRHSQNIAATYNREAKTEGESQQNKAPDDLGNPLDIAPGEPVPPGFEGEVNRQAQIQERLDGFKVGPLVALEYLVEMQDYDPTKEPTYLCILCDKKGDPRTVLTHLASYNHISQYLQKHFPTCYRALAPYMTKHYKRNWQGVLQKIAEAIEKKYGRLRPFCIDQDKFEKDRMFYLPMILKGKHFSEQNGPNFVELVVHDELTKTFDDEGRPLKPTTTFGNKAFIEREPVKIAQKRSPSPPVVARPTKRPRAAAEDTKKPSGPPNVVAKQPSGGSKLRRRSLSSVSSVSSDEGKKASGRPMARNRSPPRFSKDSGRRLYDPRDNRPPPRRRSPSPRRRPTRETEEERRKNRERERLQKLEEFTKLSKAIENDVEKTIKQYEKNPEKHPKYNDEWKLFWNRRYKELQAEGKDASKHDFKPEWIQFWGQRMRELSNEELKTRKDGLRKRLGLAEEAAPISFRIGGGPPTTNPPKTTQPKENRPNMPMAARPDNDPEVIFLDDKVDVPQPKKPANRDKDRSHSPWESDTSPPRGNHKGRQSSHSPTFDKRRFGGLNIKPRDRSLERTVENRRSPERGRRSPDRGRRSPDRGRRSLDRGRRSPEKARRSPDKGRRSPDKGRRSPEKVRRSPERVRRSPDRGRRSPVGGRRSPVGGRRSPVLGRRSPVMGRRSPVLGRRSPDRTRRSLDRGRRSPDILRSRSRDPPMRKSKERSLMKDTRDRRSMSPDSFKGMKAFPRDRDREYNRERDMRDREIDIFPPRERSWERGIRESSFERDMRGRDRIRTVADLPWEREKMMYSHGPPRMMMPHDDFYGPPSMMWEMPRKNQLNFVPPPTADDPDDGEVNIVSVLRLLTALEERLGSLGPKIIDLLAHALALEKKEANSSETLLDNEINCVMFETVKEKLKGQLLAGLVDPVQERAFKKAIQNTASLIHMASHRKSLKPPPGRAVAVPGVGAVDKAAIARQIANALVAQGKTDVTQAELEQLINAVVGMAEASKGSNKPMTTAGFLSQLTGGGGSSVTDSLKEKVIIPRVKRAEEKREKRDSITDLEGLTEPLSPSTPEKSTASNMENLSDSDLQTLLQNFKDLSTEEQMNLINYLKKLEFDEPERVERLRKFVNLSGEKPPKDIIDLDKEPSPNTNGRSSRLETNTDTDTFDKRKKNDKAEKIHMDSEDEDYSYEDVVKAASKNIKQKEMEDNRKIVEDSIGFSSAQKESTLTDAKTLISNLMSSIASGALSSGVNLLGLPTSSTTLASMNNITTPTSSADFAKAISGINMDNLASIVSNVQKASQEKKLQFEPPPTESSLSPRDRLELSNPLDIIQTGPQPTSSTESRGSINFESPGAPQGPNAGPMNLMGMGGLLRPMSMGSKIPSLLGSGPSSLLGSGPSSLLGSGPPSLLGSGPSSLNFGLGGPMNVGSRAGPGSFSQRAPIPNPFGNSSFPSQRPPRSQFNANFNSPRFGGPRGQGFNKRW